MRINLIHASFVGSSFKETSKYQLEKVNNQTSLVLCFTCFEVAIDRKQVMLEER